MLRMLLLMIGLTLLAACATDLHAESTGAPQATSPQQGDPNGQRLEGKLKDQAQAQLETNLLNKKVISKIVFPASHLGIDVSIDGKWDMKKATRCIKDCGMGIDVGDAAVITNVKLKSEHIEIHLNGGGAGTFADNFLGVDRSSEGGKVPGGSRINLHFNRPITFEDIQDLSRLASYLEPVVDPSAINQAAALAAIPAAFKRAADDGQVVQGMDKATVFAIMGEPKNKNVDMSGDVPVEKWQFDLANLKTRIVTFMQGIVVKVTEF